MIDKCLVLRLIVVLTVLGGVARAASSVRATDTAFHFTCQRPRRFLPGIGGVQDPKRGGREIGPKPNMESVE